MLLIYILAACALLAPGRDVMPFAMALADVVSSEEPLYKGDEDRSRTAALMVAVAFRESSFRTDVMGDHGRALGAFQLWDVPKETPLREQFQVAETRLRESMRICGASNILGIYAGGPTGCEMNAARRISADRSALARWVRGRLIR